MKGRIASEDFNRALTLWSGDASLFLPGPSGFMEEFSPELEYDLEKVPVWGGIKEFVYPQRGIVAGEEKKEICPVILAGIRNCDLTALNRVFDEIFLRREPQDTVYRAMRESLTLVSVDCISPAPTCFCAGVGGSPYSSGGSDLNLSPVKGGFIAESFSPAGEKLLKSIELREVSGEDEKNYGQRKEQALKALKLNFNLDYKKDSFKKKIKENDGEEYWQQKGETCMQCGGCNFSCPTCYCNILSELSDYKKPLKALQWDSCQYPGYARVAGGSTPRPRLWQGFRHRYLCKFNLMQGEFNTPGCTGCGRCIITCPGKIDMRDTVKGLYE